MPILVSVTDDGLGRKYTLRDGDLVGRAPECSVQLIAADVSKHHARLIATADGGFAIEDAGSRNGVFVNGARVLERTLLTPNCLVGFGEQSFVYEPDLAILPSDDAGALIVASDAQTVRGQVRGRALPVAASVEAELRSILADERDDVLGALVEAVSRHIGADDAAVIESGRDVSTLKRTLVVSAGLLERCMREREGIVCADHRATTGIPGVSGAVQSLVLVPLVVQGEAVGVVVWSRNGVNAFADSVLDELTRLTPLLALGLVWQRRVRGLKRELTASSASHAIVGESAVVVALRERIARIAASQATVLVAGETGSGKELIARALHGAGPFVAVNCAAIPETLVESELFGHERGAFSGADRQAIGKLELASGGTLFLDEVGELSLAVQAKLLRALEERTFYRVGGVKPVTVAFRLVAASHRDLSAMVASGAFRDDLFYRLNVVPVQAPALRERGRDIVILAQRFLTQSSRDLRLSAEAEDALLAYDWPGNVRELRNVIERAVVLSDGAEIGAVDLCLRPIVVKRDLASAKASVERDKIAEALRVAGGKKIAAARALGISRPTLDKKMAEYDL